MLSYSFLRWHSAEASSHVEGPENPSVGTSLLERLLVGLRCFELGAELRPQGSPGHAAGVVKEDRTQQWRFKRMRL